MPLLLSEGKFEEIHDFVSVIFAAYSDLYHAFVAMINPGIGSDCKETYEEGEIDAAERFLARWKAGSSEKWVKIIDDSTGDIVRCVKAQLFVTVNSQAVIGSLTSLLQLQRFKVAAIQDRSISQWSSVRRG
jgi:hypothetical protein